MKKSVIQHIPLFGYAHSMLTDGRGALLALVLLSLGMSGCANNLSELVDIHDREINSGDHAAAREEYTRMIVKLKDMGSGGASLVTSYRFRATSQMYLGNYQEALADCDAALATDISITVHSIDYCLRGHVKALLGDQKGATEDYETSMSPANTGSLAREIYLRTAHTNYAIGKTIMGDYDGAMSEIDEAQLKKERSNESNNVYSTFKSAVKKRSVGDYEGAAVDLQRTEELAKKIPHKLEVPSFGLVAYYFKKQDAEAAAIQQEVLQKAKAQEATGDKTGAFSRYCEAYAQAQKLGNQKLLDATFNEIARMYTQFPEKPTLTEEDRKYRVQAEGALNDKRFKNAADLYNKALKISPWWPAGHFNRALVLGETGDYQTAVLEMKRYLLLVPDAPDARAAQDKIYEWEGKEDANAVQTYETKSASEGKKKRVLKEQQH